jgi:hypothetical protein
MNENPLSVGASLDEIKSRIADVQNTSLDTHPGEFEELYQELNRALNEIDGL